INELSSEEKDEEIMDIDVYNDVDNDMMNVDKNEDMEDEYMTDNKCD
ncbi:32303_t:CDS:1, partial [Racocetra persica]